jgi:hypothetical protein
MKRFRITYTNGTTNEACGNSDIWTGMTDVQSVTDLGAHAVPTKAIALSKTAFRSHCVSQLGVERFQTIIDTLKGASGVLNFAYDEYAAADTFDKDRTSQFLSLIASVLEDGEHADIIGNWPTEPLY